MDPPYVVSAAKSCEYDYTLHARKTQTRSETEGKTRIAVHTHSTYDLPENNTTKEHYVADTGEAETAPKAKKKRREHEYPEAVSRTQSAPIPTSSSP